MSTTATTTGPLDGAPPAGDVSAHDVTLASTDYTF